MNIKKLVWVFVMVLMIGLVTADTLSRDAVSIRGTNETNETTTDPVYDIVNSTTGNDNSDNTDIDIRNNETKTDDNSTIEIDPDITLNNETNSTNNDPVDIVPVDQDTKSDTPSSSGGGIRTITEPTDTRKQREERKKDRDLVKEVKDKNALEREELRDYRKKLNIKEDHTIKITIAKELITRKRQDSESYESIVGLVKETTSKDEEKEVLVEELVGMDQDFVKKYKKRLDNLNTKQETQQQLRDYVEEVDEPVQSEFTEELISEVFTQQKSLDEIFELFD